MIDAYTHLDITCADPIADMKARMEHAGIEGALAVETWKGDNLPWLQRMMAEPSAQFRVVVCFRPDQRHPSQDVLQNDAVMGLRVRTTDLHQLQDVATRLETSGKWLVPHAENGIGPLRKELLALAGRAPDLRIYLPHLVWPRQNKIDTGEWEAAVSELHEIPGTVVGISALAHFSREPFPHPDVEVFAARLIEIFGPASIVVASDYPMFEKTLYTRYMQLAQAWVRRADAKWSPHFEEAFNRSGSCGSGAGA
jgi:predicted TIM-barrel fold metal-dependent hydrolase